MLNTPASPSRLSLWLVVAGLLVLPMVLYAGAIDHPFLIDDHDAIVSHPDVVKIGGLATLWGHDYWAGRAEDANLYRPITVLSYWLNWRLTPGSGAGFGSSGEKSAAGFRVVNLLLLGGIGIALLSLLKRHAGLLAGAFAAGLFIAHPVHGEAINHIVGRADLLAVLGIVGFLALQQHALHTGWTGRRIAGAALLAIIAMGAKESGFVLVPLALMQWRMGAGREGESEKGSRNLYLDIQKKVPDTFVSPHLGICRKRALLYALLLPLAVAIVARMLIVGVGADYTPGSDDLTGNPLRALGFAERLPESMGIFVWYLKQMVWPGLTFNQTPSPGSVDGPGAIVRGHWAGVEVLGAVLFFVTVAGGLALSRKRRVLALAAGLMVFHFLIVGNLLLPTGVYAANRLTVATTAGAAIALGLGLGALFKLGYRTKLAATLAAAAAVLLASAVTFMAQPDWSGELARMQADAEAQPDNPIALYWVGQAYLRADPPVLSQGLPPLEKAYALEPDSLQAMAGLAGVYLSIGDETEAWQLYRRLLEHPAPIDEATRLNASKAAVLVGEYEQAQQIAAPLPEPMARPVLTAIEQLREIEANKTDGD